MRTACLVLAGFVFSVGAAVAQDQQTNPCEENPRYREFDFWVGEWEVFTLDGTKAGDNSIQYEENGCLVVERWTSTNGGTGQSYNYYDPGTDKWRQVWVSQAAVIDYEGGLTDDGSMQLRGEIVYQRNGQTAEFMGLWTPQEDGTVRQHFEQYDAEKNEWSPWFTGIYQRKE